MKKNNRAKIFITLILGFFVGFCLSNFKQFASVLKAQVSPENVISKTKLEEFWQDSDIEFQDLKRIVNNRSCVLSEKHFLACVNSVVSALSVKQKRLSLSGEIIDISSDMSSLDNFSEKDKLVPFIKIYKENIQSTFDFEKLWKQVLKLKTQQTPEKYLIGQGINGFLSVFKDPHTYLLPLEYFEQVSSSSERSPYFVGLSLEKIRGELFIKKVIKNSDADISGLKVGDKIQTLNGIVGDKLSLSQASQILRDPQSRQISFSLLRNNNENLLKIVKRSYRVLSQVSSEVITIPSTFEKNVGLIHISKFSKNTCRDVMTSINRMQNQKINSLIIDLRDNPGGHLSEVACLAGLFLGKNKKVYSVQYFDVSRDEENVYSNSDLLYTGPLAVLVNASSASAAELFAGAMQEYRRGIVVGAKTFGKGTFQEVEIFSQTEKVGLFRTKGFYLLPSGESTQFYGVSPDFEIKEDLITQENEEVNYINPIKPQKVHSKINKLSFTFARCSQNDNIIFDGSESLNINDIVLTKSIGLLMCSELMSFVANQYSEVGLMNQNQED